MRRSLPWLLVFAAGWALARLAPAPPSATASPGAGFAHAIRTAEPSIVHVSTTLADARAARSRDDAVGAGFVLSSDGLIVTSRHVLQGARAVTVELAGRGAVQAQIVGHDDALDVSVLRVPLTGLVPLAVGDSAALSLGDWVLACGSPYALPRSWSAGIVSGLHRRGVAPNPRSYEDFIQTDAAANLGNSGGPLLDASGRVVGVVTQILTRAGGFQGISLATPIEPVMQAARRIAGGLPPAAREGLGVSVVENVQRGGLELTQVREGGVAALAGLRPGDLIKSVDGLAVQTADDLQRVLLAKRSGEVLLLHVIRVRGTVQEPVRVTLR
jgi:serine protease Do